MTKPYYSDESVTLYHGDCRDGDYIEGRDAIGVEIDERYCEIAAKRLQNAETTLFGGVA